MTKKQYQRYSPEFKIHALKRASEDGVTDKDVCEEGYDCGRRRVARLMRQAGLRGCPKRRFRVTTQRDPAHAVADNLLQQNFTASRPNEYWAADITYISTQQGWLFLAVVMDLYSRRIVGWSMTPGRVSIELVVAYCRSGIYHHPSIEPAISGC